MKNPAHFIYPSSFTGRPWITLTPDPPQRKLAKGPKAQVQSSQSAFTSPDPLSVAHEQPLCASGNSSLWASGDSPHLAFPPPSLLLSLFFLYPAP